MISQQHLPYYFLILFSWMEVIMDKSWIHMPRNIVKYLDVLNKFLDFAFENQFVNVAIWCPCPKCCCNKWETRDIVCDHLICKQFPKNYKVWNDMVKDMKQWYQGILKQYSNHCKMEI
ncbi:hypothetical protein CR513_42759, partial [Mucuna pruriens]